MIERIVFGPEAIPDITVCMISTNANMKEQTVKIVLAPDKFKGSLTATRVAEHLARGLRYQLPDADLTIAPIADGGDGTVEAVVRNGFMRVPVTVRGPFGAAVHAEYAIKNAAGGSGIDGNCVAVIELAQASGLIKLPRDPDERPILDALGASSIGTGDLILAALDYGADTIVIAVGGSACTDGGSGMVAALGARLVDANDKELELGGGSLVSLKRADFSNLDPRINKTNFILAFDVTSPLLGARGAASSFGPQKGATERTVEILDTGLRRLTHQFGEALGRHALPSPDTPGAGAAGGVGYAALAVLGAQPRPGIDVVFDLCKIEENLFDADLVITGEGSIDKQTLEGKAPVGVARLARAHGIEVMAVCGRSDLSVDQVWSAGINAVYPLTDLEPDMTQCIANSPKLLEQLGSEIGTELASR